MGTGSGFVFAVQEVDGEWHSFVMTAKHVIDYVRPDERTIQAHFFVNKGITLSAEVAYEDDTYDFAILVVPFRHLYAAVIAESSPQLFQKVYAAGCAVVGVPLCNPGELTGEREEDWFLSSPVNWGYSGGPALAYISGQWRVIGVVVAMGKARDPLGVMHPIYHTAAVLKMDIILAKLEAEQTRR